MTVFSLNFVFVSQGPKNPVVAKLISRRRVSRAWDVSALIVRAQEHGKQKGMSNLVKIP